MSKDTHSDLERPHVVWHDHAVSRQQREKLLNQHGRVVWFTGLSGCGKSTIANLLDQLLCDQGHPSFLLDGDNIRHGLCATPDQLRQDHDTDFAARFGLGFAATDREENIRRIGSVAELFAASGLITLVAFVSPYRRDRDAVRRRVETSGGRDSFVEVFVDTPLEECERRDPKGLYQKARRGEIKNFTGISDPYEPPHEPEVHLKTVESEPREMAAAILDYLAQTGTFR